MDKSKVIRREMKEKRRSEMPNVMEMLERIKKNNKDNVDFIEALKIVDEIIKRSYSSITIEELKQYISKYIKEVVIISKGKINKSSQKIDEINNEISMLWTELKNELIDLNSEAIRQKNKLEKSLNNVISEKNMGNSEFDLNLVKKGLKAQIDAKESKLSLSLLAICCIEFVLYVVFFCIKRRKTNSFKKAD